jgi:hypothetical protein
MREPKAGRSHSAREATIMKRSCLHVCVVLAAFMFSLFAGGFLCVERALAVGPGDACQNPTATNYKKCSDCQCKVLFMGAGPPRVAGGFAQDAIQCTKIKSCYSNPIKNAKYDLNGDGKIDATDATIARKCVNCTLTPSPF